MSRYASETTVDVDRSRNDVERTLMRYGADEFGYAVRKTEVTIGFVMNGLTIRLTIPMPARDEQRFTHHSRGARTATAAENEYEQAVRQRWRAILLVVKAKLEAVEAGISTLEREFLADVVTDTGVTMAERVEGLLVSARRTTAAIGRGA